MLATSHKLGVPNAFILFFDLAVLTSEDLLDLWDFDDDMKRMT
jgi:hypothetical protein